jgi:hypothetical protein
MAPNEQEKEEDGMDSKEEEGSMDLNEEEKRKNTPWI